MENSIIYTPEFKKWFGDWETNSNHSLVVDDNGMPLVVYHGSDADFNEFNSEFIGKTGTALGQGFYFTNNQTDASGFGSNVKSFYLNIRKPLNSNKLTIKKNELYQLLDTIDKTQCQNDNDFGYGILSDYGDVDYEGREKVLRYAVNLEMENQNDVELIGGLINTTNDYNLVVNVLYNLLGYDGVINDERGIYVIHHSFQAKRITNSTFTNKSNNFNESKKKIYITEEQLDMLTKK